jgi:hypothetical protein
VPDDFDYIWLDEFIADAPHWSEDDIANGSITSCEPEAGGGRVPSPRSQDAREAARSGRRPREGNRAIRRIDRPLAHAPLVLAQENAAELDEPVRTILECSEGLLALGDRQREGCPARLEAVAVRTRVRCSIEDRHTEERSRPGWAGSRPPFPLSPEEEMRGRSGFRIAASALQRPARCPAAGGRLEPDLGVEDLGALGDANLADDEPFIVRNHPDFAVVATAERADDVAEVGRILHCGEGIA